MPVIISKAIGTPKGLIEFRFEPLNINQCTIFAVYCSYAGTQYCFHLAKNENLEFYIMDKQNCPYDFLDLEQLLSNAIEEFSE